ncbi:MAG: toll/interleukin-1 receptor domain-containing protein [Lachnospiraceae bacterium]|nr:toll/interleukin-1 receptor domain-containing protein [Lachnospiraceae bacterium]
MEIEALNCRCCGGVLNVDSALCVCKYCGATNFISDTANKYINQLNRANKLRQEKEYDNAIRIYDNILAENVATADILWLRTLCEYGIEYVPDPISSKYFPTLHRIKDESILNYHSYKDALELCDEKQRAILEVEAAEINRIQTDYLDIAKNEAPYDVFICYKETDEDTKETTEDVEYCTQLYDILTKDGFKVFFARVTLQDKLSVDYEPYIFAALKSSKAMAVIGSKSEYFTSIWVKNEWSRFLKLMETDSDKQMFFACDDPEELPRAFSLKQAQLLSEQNAMENLAKNIERYLTVIVKAEKNGKVGSRRVGRGEAESMYESAIKKANVGNFPAALSTVSDLIELYPNMPEAYWLRMAVKIHHNADNIKFTKKDLTLFEDYNKALSLADPNLKAHYVSIKDKCLGNLKLQNEFYDEMNSAADEFESNLPTNNFYTQRQDIVAALDKIDQQLKENTIYSTSLKRSYEAKIAKYLSDIDSLSARILNEFASLGLTKYREFCAKYNVSEKVEIDMESTHYVALRSKLVKENIEIKEKYNSLEVLVQNPNDTYKEKIEEDDALNGYYRMVVNKVQE